MTAMQIFAEEVARLSQDDQARLFWLFQTRASDERTPRAERYEAWRRVRVIEGLTVLRDQGVTL